jgi:hypothetical protein
MTSCRNSDSAFAPGWRRALFLPRLTAWLLVAAIAGQGMTSPPVARAWLPETFEQGEGPADSRELPVEEQIAGLSSLSTIRFSIAGLHRGNILPHAASCRRSINNGVLGLRSAELEGRNGIGAPLRC